MVPPLNVDMMDERSSLFLEVEKSEAATLSKQLCMYMLQHKDQQWLNSQDPSGCLNSSPDLEG